MGVMECSRRGCTSVMCDRYNQDHGYICSDCFEELCNLGVQVNIKTFMESEKEKKSFEESGAVHAYFDTLFPSE